MILQVTWANNIKPIGSIWLKQPSPFKCNCFRWNWFFRQIVEEIKKPLVNCITGEFFLYQVCEGDHPIWLWHFSFSPAFCFSESADLSISRTNVCFSAVPVFSPPSRMEIILLLRVQSAKLVPEFSFSSSFCDRCAISILNEIPSPFIYFFHFVSFSGLMQERQAYPVPWTDKFPLFCVATGCGDLKTHPKFILEDTQTIMCVKKKGFLGKFFSCLWRKTEHDSCLTVVSLLEGI